MRCSVVIPAYNAARYLASSIRSALCQTFADVEVVVVDDGSTDRTAEVMESFGDRIIGICQPNQGPSVARNVGLKAASGAYVAFLDADDLWMPRRLERMIGRLEEDHAVGFVTSDAYVIQEDAPTSLRYYETLADPGPFAAPNQDYWIARGNFVFTGVVARTELFDRHGTFRPKILAEDWDLWARFILGGERAGLVDIPLGYYRVRKDGLCSSKGFDEHWQAAQRRTLRDPRAQKIPGLGRDLYLPLARQALENQDLEFARFCLAAAAQDRLMKNRSRALAGLMAALPKVAVKGTGLSARKAHNRLNDRLFELAGGKLRDARGQTYLRARAGFQGYVESTGRAGPVSGWAVGGRKARPADVVAIFVDGEFQTAIVPAVPRPDVTHHTGNPASMICGWVSDSGIDPQPARHLQVFAISGRRFYELPLLEPPTTGR